MPTGWSGLTSRILAIAGVFAIVAGLRLGQGFFLPLALAILFSLMLSPLVGVGQRLRLPRVVSVVVVVALVFGMLGLTGYFIAGQAAALGKKLPEYRAKAVAKLESVRIPVSKGVDKVRKVLKEVENGPEGKPAKPGSSQDPVKVEVVEGSPDAFKIATLVLGPLMTLGASFAVVVVFVIFFLIYEAEIRDRVIRLAGDARINVTTQAITEATKGVSRYLFLQAIVNTSYGVTLGLGLFVLGVPGALLWGFLAAVLRFVPYLGPIGAGLLPIVLAFAVFPGWARPLAVAGFIAVLELLSNNLVEPVVYGKRTGLSPLAVIVAAVFWAWMWGGVGLILAVPLTLCLLTLGKHVPSLGFLGVALGDEPALESKVQVYHRLLGHHQEEAAELLEKERAGGKPLAEFYDGVVLPVIRMAEGDLQQGKLDEEKAAFVFAALHEIIDDFAESSQPEGERQAPGGSGEEPRGTTVLCLPASDHADELSATMLSQVLSLRGCRAKVVPVEKMAGETMDIVRAERADILVICTSPPSNLLRARYLYKRLRRRFGDIPIVEGVWGADTRMLEGRIAPDGKASLVSSFVEAEKAVIDLSREAVLRYRLKQDSA